VTLESVSATGAASGVVLANTGAGGFTVTGTGAAGSGGAILASTGVGVSLTNTGPVSLTDFAVTGGGDDGVRGTGVNGLQLDATTVSNNGNAAGERGLDLVNLSASSASPISTLHRQRHRRHLDRQQHRHPRPDGDRLDDRQHAQRDRRRRLIIEANGTSTIRASVTDSTFSRQSRRPVPVHHRLRRDLDQPHHLHRQHADHDQRGGARRRRRRSAAPARRTCSRVEDNNVQARAAPRSSAMQSCRPRRGRCR
jgi:hypothetical protein